MWPWLLRCVSIPMCVRSQVDGGAKLKQQRFCGSSRRDSVKKLSEQITQHHHQGQVCRKRLSTVVDNAGDALGARLNQWWCHVYFREERRQREERIRERSRRLAEESSLPNRMDRQLRETGRFFTSGRHREEKQVCAATSCPHSMRTASSLNFVWANCSRRVSPKSRKCRISKSCTQSGTNTSAIRCRLVLDAESWSSISRLIDT